MRIFLGLHERLGFMNNLKRICDFYNKFSSQSSLLLRVMSTSSNARLKVKPIHQGLIVFSKRPCIIKLFKFMQL